jgi:hypothetical protein
MGTNFPSQVKAASLAAASDADGAGFHETALREQQHRDDEEPSDFMDTRSNSLPTHLV